MHGSSSDRSLLSLLRVIPTVDDNISMDVFNETAIILGALANGTSLVNHCVITPCVR